MGFVDDEHVPLAVKDVDMSCFYDVATQVLKSKKHHCSVLSFNTFFYCIGISCKHVGIYKTEVLKVFNAFYRFLPFILNIRLARNDQYRLVVFVRKSAAKGCKGLAKTHHSIHQQIGPSLLHSLFEK